MLELTIEELNRKYGPLKPEQRLKELYNDFSKILYTSSFGTTAVYLLHLFSKVNPRQEIYFLDTTYHFPETLAYKEQLTQLLGLNVKELKGDAWRNQFTHDDRTWEKDPDLCCSVNKVEPLETLRQAQRFEVWVSGLMSGQNEHRSALKIVEQKNDII